MFACLPPADSCWVSKWLVPTSCPKTSQSAREPRWRILLQLCPDVNSASTVLRADEYSAFKNIWVRGYEADGQRAHHMDTVHADLSFNYVRLHASALAFSSFFLIKYHNVRIKDVSILLYTKYYQTAELRFRRLYSALSCWQLGLVPEPPQLKGISCREEMD